jgi:hypothetical protein
MGALEAAVDAAADLVGPLLVKGNKGLLPTFPGPVVYIKLIMSAEDTASKQEEILANKNELVVKALGHLETINEADKAQDPNAPYDASLVGIVYGLMDVITLQGIVPSLSRGV